MELKIVFAAVASIMALIGNIPYLRDVISRKIRPHPYTWLIWTIVSGTTFIGGLVKGAGIGAIPTGISESFTLLIFLFSLRNGFDGVTKTDNYFLAVALVSLIPWFITKDPTMSVIIVVIIDLIAFMPTFRKTWHHPHTENSVLYTMNITKHILTLLSLQTYNIATALHSISMTITNTIMTVIIYVRRKKGKIQVKF